MTGKNHHLVVLGVPGTLEIFQDTKITIIWNIISFYCICPSKLKTMKIWLKTRKLRRIRMIIFISLWTSKKLSAHYWSAVYTLCNITWFVHNLINGFLTMATKLTWFTVVIVYSKVIFWGDDAFGIRESAS